MFADEVALTDHVVDGMGPESLGQGRIRRQGVVRSSGEEIGTHRAGAYRSARIQRPPPSLSAVKLVVVVIIIVVVVAAVAWIQIDARRQRIAMLEQILAEESAREVANPTAQLFRSEGVPVPPDLDAGPEPGPPPDEVAAPTSDLTVLCRGITLPCGLAPTMLGAAGNVDDGRATFATSEAGLYDVIRALAAEFVRIGCDVKWTSDSTAAISREGHRGELSLEAGVLANGLEGVTATIEAI